MSKIIRKIKLPFRWIRKESRNWKPPGFRGLSFYDVMQFITRHYDIPGLTEKAAAISYNFIMAIPPTFLFIFTLIPQLPFISRSLMKDQLHRFIQDIIPSPAYHQNLISFVDWFIDSSKFGVLSSAFVISLFFASNGMMGLMRSFNKAEYIGFKKNRGLKQRWEAIKLTLIIFALLLITLILLFLQGNILEWLGIHNDLVKRIILMGKWGLIVSLIFFIYAFIYRYAPSTTKRWKLFSPGAIIATGLSIIVTTGFMFFVMNFGQYNFLYGSVGSVMVVMIMIFLNSLVAFIGFIFNLSIHLLCNRSERAGKVQDTDHA